jgi:hypothetical protein
MRKEMIENAAYEVATQVRTVEDSIDTTLAEIAELQSRVMHANSVARVGPAPIHAALEEISTALRVMASWSSPRARSRVCAPSPLVTMIARRRRLTPTCASSPNR